MSDTDILPLHRPQRNFTQDTINSYAYTLHTELGEKSNSHVAWTAFWVWENIPPNSSFFSNTVQQVFPEQRRQALGPKSLHFPLKNNMQTKPL